MFRKLRWIIGLNHRNSSTKRLLNAEQPGPARANQLSMLEAVHEVAIYIHRFHNLDLFEQGWYQIKVTMRWEDDKHSSPGIPARVAQYEAPEMGSDNLCGVWRIDDTDNSFSTPCFRVRYARQNIFLSIMVSFNLSFYRYEGQPTSAIMLKFELMHAPISGTGLELQDSLGVCPVSVHEYRIPPKALIGLHSYCPVHFDASHAVVVDTSVHISLRAGVHTTQSNIPSDSRATEGTRGEGFDLSKKALGEMESSVVKEEMLIKELTAARDILLQDLSNISRGINESIDLNVVTPKLDDMKLLGSSPPASLEKTDGEVSEHLSGMPQNSFEEVRGFTNFQSEGPVQYLSWEDLVNSFESLGNQISCLWNNFLNFHRANKTKILEFLSNSWAKGQRAECSIWMVYSKVEMPHCYISNGPEGTSCHPGIRGRALSLQKSTEEPAQAAAMRAELHRKSIAQMSINSQSLQDMYITKDPLRVPIIITERITSIPLCSASVNSYVSPLEQKDTSICESGLTIINKLSGTSSHYGHVLKIVVFVHGFQGHHLDLRLVRNQWLLIDPTVEFLMSETNEDKTSGDLREMGLRLAHEVISFLKKKMDRVSRSGNLESIKLSFVGHSIGNIIIRTALAESIMEPYLHYLYTYVSISGPHLGYLYSSNPIFNSGLWLLKKLKGLQCFHQLTLTDDPDLRRTFFYKLSKQKTLENFRNVLLLSSPQDGYVPYHSARMELYPAAFWDNSKRGKVYLEMLNNCLDQILASLERRVVMRCDINFGTSSQGRNLSTLIGRAAHIEFLESDIFVRFIMWSFPELFL
ncbi:hypothetical protein O6P43_031564 [Quillaja saponaria]|uniref:DUF676 domain-containing protein n=1 Tax=Quillaja saponaria TaxID=32244 RepID=A0AAD7KVA1_QUISA|nr:hypothetical protein O6P43_031564 [Quillaja saponaria]